MNAIVGGMSISFCLLKNLQAVLLWMNCKIGCKWGFAGRFASPIFILILSAKELTVRKRPGVICFRTCACETWKVELWKC
jgi:hypothetical protein